jgi:hypothetical protein
MISHIWIFVNRAFGRNMIKKIDKDLANYPLPSTITHIYSI